MASRAARGALIHGRRSVVLLYSKPYLDKVLGPFKAHIERDTLQAFLPKDRDRMRNVVTLHSIARLMKSSAKTCHRVALLGALVGKKNAEALTECNDCAACKRIMQAMFHETEMSQQDTQDLESDEETEVFVPGQPLLDTPPEIRARVDRVRACGAEAEDADSAHIRADVIRYLAGRGSICLGCDNDHMPNACQKLDLAREECRQCFSKEHNFAQFRQALEKVGTSAKPGQSQEDWLHRKRNDKVINGCALVYQEHLKFNALKPCSKCWLSHDDNESGCRGVNNFHVRYAFLFLWRNKGAMKEFVSKGRREKWLSSADDLETWPNFMAWGVYSGTLKLQHAFAQSHL